MSYQKWITVNVEHSYFSDGRCHNLRFEPTTDCRKKMRRSGNFFYPTPIGFIIFKETANIKENVKSTTGGCVFDIEVYSTDGFFASYSNLEIDYRQGKIYYVGSPSKPGADKSKEKRLTLVERDSGKEVEAVPVTLKLRQNVKTAFIVSIDDTRRDYNIRVASRPVSWEYHVIANENHRKLNQLAIRNNNEKLLPGLLFKQTRIDEQRKEAVFISSQPIPLTERPYQSIELIEKNSSGTPLIPHLPNADISSLHVKEKKWAAKIYVYI